MKKLFLFAVLPALYSIISCGIQTVQGGDGGATETVNARVIISDSTVAVTLISDTGIYADVIIADENYNPVTQTGICDSATGIPEDSTVTFNNLNGRYNILIHNRFTQAAIAFRNIVAGAHNSDTITDTLNESGSVEGMVAINDTTRDIKSLVKVYIRGTPYFTQADSNGVFQLSGIPRGNFFLKAAFYNLKSDPIKNINRSIGKEIVINSSKATDVGTLFFSE